MAIGRLLRRAVVQKWCIATNGDLLAQRASPVAAGASGFVGALSRLPVDKWTPYPWAHNWDNGQSKSLSLAVRTASNGRSACLCRGAACFPRPTPVLKQRGGDRGRAGSPEPIGTT